MIINPDTFLRGFETSPNSLSTIRPFYRDNFAEELLANVPRSLMQSTLFLGREGT